MWGGRLSVLVLGFLVLSVRAETAIGPLAFNRGGWGLDQQSMAELGTPYLIAHGLGSPVADATARFTVERTGRHHVWVRTRNWHEGEPGRFRLAIDGQELQTVFGVGSASWDWVDGGTVELAAGAHLLALKDLTGFDGRCAGVVIGGDRPPSGVLPLGGDGPAESVACDLVVVGAGPAGTAAAVAAARRGLKVALLNDRGVLGGNSSSEIRVGSCGEIRHPIVKAIANETNNRCDLAEVTASNRLAVVRAEKNVDLRLWHRAVSVVKDGDRIASVRAIDLSRNLSVDFTAPLFVDATGDGWIGYWAGADYRMGREGRAETGESLAPEKGDKDTLGASIMWNSVETDAPVAFSAPWAEAEACGYDQVEGEWFWETGLHRDMTTETEAIRDHMLTVIYGTFSRAKRKPENANRKLHFCPYLLGKRESRRLLGDYILTQDDVLSARPFPDAVATGSWSIDLHYDDVKPGVDFITRCDQTKTAAYWIPYRSLYSRNVPNLFVVGRALSATHVAFGSTRVMNTLAQTGVAVGEAAAICRTNGLLPRGIWAQGRIHELQQAIGGDWPGEPTPEHKGLKIVDDETPGAMTFEGDGWFPRHPPNGGMTGVHCTSYDKNKPHPKRVVVKLPMYDKIGRYELYYRVPYQIEYLEGHYLGTNALMVADLVSGSRRTRLSWNPLVKTGTWNLLGTFDFTPGTTLELLPQESEGEFFVDGFATREILPDDPKPVDLVSYVDPMIGAVTYPEEKIDNVHGFGKTFPGAATPFGMIQLSPDTITGGDNGSGYSYSHKTIEGFSFLHMSGVGWYGEFGNFQVMVGGKGPSAFSHANEVAKAGYYKVRLDDVKTTVEATADESAGVLAFTFEEAGEQTLTIDLARRIGELTRAKPHGRQTFRMVAPDEFVGSIVCDHRDGGWGRGGGQVDYTVHFHGVVSKPFASVTDTDDEHNLVVTAKVPAAAGETLLMKVALSFDTLPPRPELTSFAAARAHATKLWRDAFDVIRVTGGTERERTIFATSLYHAFIDPRAIGKKDGYTQRTIFSGWDVFRHEFPLLCLVRPDVVRDTILSMMDVVARGDRDTLPVWDVFGCKSGCMIGNPIIPVMAMAVEAGITNFDTKAMYELAKETSAKRGNLPSGVAPGGSLSETLEYAYDDWCMMKLAERFGTPDEVAYYAARAKAYTNCWDRSVGWFRSKAKNGDGWLEPWQGRGTHGQGCVESNPYQQGWFVPHDPDGLAALLGGREKAVTELEAFFANTPETFEWNDFYNHANEPVHHVSALFAAWGRHDLAEKWTARVREKAYGTGPYGLCGNEDVGQMSAWYVLAAIGRLPLDPAAGKWYDISPVFATVELRPKRLAANQDAYVKPDRLTAHYAVGETARLSLLKRDETGRVIRGQTPEIVTVTADRPGFKKVRLPDGRDYGVAFDAEQIALEKVPEPSDFDEFWQAIVNGGQTPEVKAGLSPDEKSFIAAVRAALEKPAAERLGTDPDGAVALAVAALDPTVTRCVAYVPVFPANSAYCRGESFARRVSCPVRFVVGFADPIATPESVYSVYNACAAKDKAIFDGIGMGHEVFPDFVAYLEAWRRPVQSASYRFLAFNIWGDFFGNPPHERDLREAELIRRHNPDFFGLQEMTDGFWSSRLVPELEKDYIVVGRALGVDGRPYACPVGIRRSRFDLIDQGAETFCPELDWSKGVSWAVVRDRTNGAKFVVFASHFWWQERATVDDWVRLDNARRLRARLWALAKAHDAAIIGGGDLNTSMDSWAMRDLVKGGLSDAQETAVVSPRGVSTDHLDPVRDPNGNYVGVPAIRGIPERLISLDHIFYDATRLTAKRFDIDMTPEACALSDHHPILLDFDLK